MILENLAKIRRRIDEAARRAGRNPDEIKLVAVAKGQPPEKVIEAVAAGATDIGENYAQEMLAHTVPVGARSPRLPIHWHFIGHLQRNKVKQIINKVALIHSVDSFDLASEIDKRAKAIGKIQPILIEVNLGGEKSKTGMAPSEVAALVKEMESLPHSLLKGFMAIPPDHPDPEEVRPYFRKLREIRDAIQGKIDYVTELSMGMTHDFEVAIEEGATIVRIGTGIFGERTKD